MKRWMTFLLTIFYLILSLGLNVSLHFCGEKLQDIAFFSNAHPCPMQCKKGDRIEKSCCHSDSALFGIEEEHQSNSLLKAPEIIAIVPIHFHYESIFTFTLDKPLTALSRDGPDKQLYSFPPIYLKHQSLLFYA